MKNPFAKSKQPEEVVSTQEPSTDIPIKTRRTLKGVVVSNKMKDTIVVEVKTFKKHPRVGKYILQSKKYKAHDAGNTKAIGDTVTIEECRPISKDKHFIVI